MKLVNLLDPARWQARFRSISWKLKNRLHALVLRRIQLTWELKSGIKVKVLSLGDWAIYNDIFVEGEYDSAIEAGIEAHGGNAGPLNVVDLGANVGFFTLRAAHRCGVSPRLRDNFHITCVEGSPAIHAELQRRIAQSPTAASRVRIFHGLVGGRSGSGYIMDTAFHPMTTVTKDATQGVAVGFLDLESILDPAAPIHLLKCDIEGAEESFIENYSSLLRRTRCAVFEMHHDKCDRMRCASLLQQCGFTHRQVLAEGKYTSLEFYSRPVAAACLPPETARPT